MKCDAYFIGVKFFEKDSVACLTGAPFLALLNAFVALFNRGAAISIIFSATKTLCKKMNVEHQTIIFS